MVVAHIAGKATESELGAWLVSRIKECGYQCPDYDEGTINDLVADERIKLVIKTNRQTLSGYLQYCQRGGAVVANPPDLIGF